MLRNAVDRDWNNSRIDVEVDDDATAVSLLDNDRRCGALGDGLAALLDGGACSWLVELMLRDRTAALSAAIVNSTY